MEFGRLAEPAGFGGRVLKDAVNDICSSSKNYLPATCQALSGNEASSLVKAPMPVMENKNNDLHSICMLSAWEMKKNRTK